MNNPENRLNMSYQSKKKRFFIVFSLILTVVFLSSCSSVSDKKNYLFLAENFMSSGEFNRLKSLADSLKTAATVSSSELAKIDSLVEISERIRLDFRLPENEVKNRLLPYFPTLDSAQLHSWEKNLKIEIECVLLMAKSGISRSQ